MCKRAFIRRIALAIFVIIFAALVAGSPQAQASSAPSYGVAVDAPVVAQQQPRGESELPWLFAVYIITWAAFFGYVFVMSRRQREMRREIEALKKALAEREPQETPAEGQTRETT